MSEITPEKIRQFLDLDLGPNDSHATTARGYLLRLLRDVWTQQEGFDGKRPFGNSSWDYDVKVPMLKAGLISGKLDSDGYADHLDDAAADALVLAAIEALDVPRAVEPATAKVVVVTEADGQERRYAADGFSLGLFGMSVTSGEKVVARYTVGTWTEPVDHVLEIRADDGEGRKGRVATYSPGAWLSVRRDGAEAPGGTEAALRLATRTLERIAGNAAGESVAAGIAREALNGIFAETG